MANKDNKGRWIDAAGNPVPVKYIDPVDKQRDRLVEKDFRLALKAQDQLSGFKKRVLVDINKYMTWLADKNGEDQWPQGGNLTLTSFSGNKRLQIKINKVIEFDERLQLAKQKIDRCLEKWSEGADDKIKVIIFDAFKVDQKGRVDTRRILGLRKLQIKDAAWKAAMDLISEAVMITGTRSYLTFQEKEGVDSEWTTLRLDLAGV